MDETMQDLLACAAVKEAMDFIARDAQHTLAQQLALTQIPAPSGDEGERALRFKALLEAEGYQAELDAAGNVCAAVEGLPGGPNIMLAAHLDTVFLRGTDLQIRRDGEKLCAPGIGDDTRALAEILSIARALRHSPVPFRGRLLLCADVGEEGLGDLHGVRHIFSTRNDIDGFVSIDASLAGAIVYGGTGSRRYRATYSGPGGHSFGAFGLPNPIHALGRAIGQIADLQAPAAPKTTFNVGVISGGTSVNSIPNEASMLIDLRSQSAEALDKIDRIVQAIIRAALDAENARWNHAQKLALAIVPLGSRPAGSQPRDCSVVRTFEAANRAVGISTKLVEASSTDCNIPISLGIPAVAVGRGGEGGGNHSLDEWFLPAAAHLGPQRDLLGVLALLGVEDVCAPALGRRQR